MILKEKFCVTVFQWPKHTGSCGIPYCKLRKMFGRPFLGSAVNSGLMEIAGQSSQVDTVYLPLRCQKAASSDWFALCPHQTPEPSQYSFHLGFIPFIVKHLSDVIPQLLILPSNFPQSLFSYVQAHHIKNKPFFFFVHFVFIFLNFLLFFILLY